MMTDCLLLSLSYFADGDDISRGGGGAGGMVVLMIFMVISLMELYVTRLRHVSKSCMVVELISMGICYCGGDDGGNDDEKRLLHHRLVVLFVLY